MVSETGRVTAKGSCRWVAFAASRGLPYLSPLVLVHQGTLLCALDTAAAHLETHVQVFNK